ncbi:hypothetical protein ACIQI8_27390 [Streptomyces sp. NPDC092369]|uniref:hypothetical protein n=1 Tax=Streptomyces sp. NPDC092369 TaxID=3366015 RepID=UPI00382F602D
MEAPPTPQSITHITRHYSGLRALYGPSVITEAALLLDALYGTAGEHGHSREDRLGRLGGLITAAAEASAGKYGRPAVERTGNEIAALLMALRDAFQGEGLTVTGCQVRLGVAVEPLRTEPRWGLDGRTGLAVAVYSDSGWELLVNQASSTVVSIHAPTTKDGAREVAGIVKGILKGEIADPFRRAQW